MMYIREVIPLKDIKFVRRINNHGWFDKKEHYYLEVFHLIKLQFNIIYLKVSIY